MTNKTYLARNHMARIEKRKSQPDTSRFITYNGLGLGEVAEPEAKLKY